MECFWPKCSDHKRCEAFGSCMAKDQKANLDKLFPQQMVPDTSPLTHQEIFSAVYHHAKEIVRLVECVPVECKPTPHSGEVL